MATRTTSPPEPRRAASAGAPGRPSSRPAAKRSDGDAHFRHAYTRDRSALQRRLARIEGQVRGIARMVERDEYCMDILQQTAALRAAVDSLNLLVLEEHVAGCLKTAVERGQAELYTEEVMDVVRRTMGRPVRVRTPGD